MRTASVLVIAALLTACSPSKPANPPPDTNTPAAFCSALQNAWFDGVIACSGVSPSQVTLDRIHSQPLPDSCEGAIAAIADGRVTFDPSSAAACVARWSGAPCAYFKDEEDDVDAFDECLAVFQGTAAAGEDCYSEYDCGGGYCPLANNVCPGTCVSWGQLGSPCGGPTDAECGPHLYCNGGQCAAIPARAGENQHCNDWQKCDLGLTCNANSLCVPQLGTGSPCNGDSQCTPGLFCYFDAAGQSRACLPMLPLGSSCADYPDRCIDGACNSAGGCADSPGPGESCVGSGGRLLACVDSWCNGASCQGYLEVGATCTGYGQCGPGAGCDGVCTATAICAP